MLLIQWIAFENIASKMVTILCWPQCVNILRLRQNSHHFADNIFTPICLIENCILIPFSVKFVMFVSQHPIHNNPALVQVMAFCWTGDKPGFWHIIWSWWVNSLWPSDTIWWHRSWSTLVQVMACCLTAPSHYLNQYWLIISKVLWHSSEDIVIRRFEDTNQ